MLATRFDNNQLLVRNYKCEDKPIDVNNLAPYTTLFMDKKQATLVGYSGEKVINMKIDEFTRLVGILHNGYRCK